MKTAATVLEIGSKVKVDLSKVKDRIPRKLIILLAKEPHGTIMDYKMTDGTGIGLVLKLCDDSISWFFAEELEMSSDKTINKSSSQGKFISKEKSISRLKSTRVGQISNSSNEESSLTIKEISFLINPQNFIKWFLYSIKDIT